MGMQGFCSYCSSKNGYENNLMSNNNIIKELNNNVINDI